MHTDSETEGEKRTTEMNKRRKKNKSSRTSSVYLKLVFAELLPCYSVMEWDT